MLRHSARPTVHPLPCVHIEVEDEEVLCLGSSDEEDAHQRRAKKRRRTELSKLFLEGTPLYIESAHLRGPFEKGWSNPWVRGPRVRPKIEQGSRGDRRRAATAQKQARSSQVVHHPDRRDGVSSATNVRNTDQAVVVSDERTPPDSTRPSPNRELSPSRKPSVASDRAPEHRARADIAENGQQNEAWLGRNGNYVPRDRPDHPVSPTPALGRDRQDRVVNGHPNILNMKSAVSPPPPPATTIHATQGDLQTSRLQSPPDRSPITNGVAPEHTEHASAYCISPKQLQLRRRREGPGPEFIPPKDRGKSDRSKATVLQTNPENRTSYADSRNGTNVDGTKGLSDTTPHDSPNGTNSRRENGHIIQAPIAQRREAPVTQNGSLGSEPQYNLDRSSLPASSNTPQQMKADIVGKPRTDHSVPHKRKLSFTDSGNVKTSKRPAPPLNKKNAYDNYKAPSSTSNHPRPNGYTFTNAMNAISNARSGEQGVSRQSTHVTSTHLSDNHVNGVDRMSSAKTNAPNASASAHVARQAPLCKGDLGHARTNADTRKPVSTSTLSDRDISLASPQKATQDDSKSTSANGSLRFNGLPPIGSLPSISDLPEAQIVPPPPLLQNRSTSSFSYNALNTVESLPPAPNTLKGKDDIRYRAGHSTAQSPASNEASFEGDSYAGLSTQAAFSKAQEALRIADSPQKPSAPPTVRKSVSDTRPRDFSLDTPQSQLPGTPYILENLKNTSPIDSRSRSTTSQQPTIADGEVQPRASFPLPSEIPAAQRQDHFPLPKPAARREGQQDSRAPHPTIGSENQRSSKEPPAKSPVRARRDERRDSPTTMLKRDLTNFLKFVRTELDKLAKSAEDTAGENLDMALFQQFKENIGVWADGYLIKMIPEEEMDRGKTEEEKTMAKKQRNVAIRPYSLLLEALEAVGAGNVPAKDWPLEVKCQLAAIKWPSHRRQSQLEGEKPIGLAEQTGKVLAVSTEQTPTVPTENSFHGPQEVARTRPAPPTIAPVMIAKETPASIEAKGQVTSDSDVPPLVNTMSKIAAPPQKPAPNRSPPVSADTSRTPRKPSPTPIVAPLKQTSPDVPLSSYHRIPVSDIPPPTFSQIFASQLRSADKADPSNSSQKSQDATSGAKDPEAGKLSHPLPPKPPTPVSQPQVASPSSQLQTTFAESSPVPKASPTQVSPLSVTNGKLPNSSSSSTRRKSAPPTQDDEVIVLPDDDEDDDECMIIPDPSSQISQQSSFAQDGQQQPQQYRPPPSTGGSSLTASTPWTAGQAPSSQNAKRPEPSTRRERPNGDAYTHGQRRDIPIEQRNAAHEDRHPQPQPRPPKSRHSENQLHRNRPLEPKTVHYHNHHNPQESIDGRRRMKPTDAKGINGMIHGRPNPVMQTPPVAAAEFNILGAANNNNFQHNHHSNNHDHHYTTTPTARDDTGGHNASSGWDGATAQALNEFSTFLGTPLDAVQGVGGTNAASGITGRRPDSYR